MPKCEKCEIISVIYLMLKNWLELLEKDEKNVDAVKMEIISILKTIKK